MSKSFLQKNIVSIWIYFCNIFAHTSFVQIRWWTPGVVLTSRDRTIGGRTTRVLRSRCLRLWPRSSTSSSRCRWWLPWTTLFRHFSRLTLRLRLLHRRSPTIGVPSSWGVTRAVERQLDIAQCDDRERVLYAAGQLRGAALDWWESHPV